MKILLGPEPSAVAQSLERMRLTANASAGDEDRGPIDMRTGQAEAQNLPA